MATCIFLANIFVRIVFSVVKSDLLIRALLLDRILVTEKTMRTTRVHLSSHVITVSAEESDLLGMSS